MSVAKGFRLSDDSTAKLDWNYVTKPDGSKSIIEEVNDVKQDLQSLIDGGAGMSEDFKQALHNILEKVAYIDGDGQDYLDALDSAMWPPTNLTSISCVYTQSGTVYETDTLDSLKSDLVVTAHYSDSTTETITSYTLSGTLAEGTSTITVSYGGKTTTFNVTVTTSAIYTLNNQTFNGTSDYVDTGIQLLTTDADLTIAIDFTASGDYVNNVDILHCCHETNTYPGMAFTQYNNQSNQHKFRFSYYDAQTNTYMADWDTNRHRFIFKHTAGTGAGQGTKYFDSVEYPMGTPISAGYSSIAENLLIGCYQNTSGTKGRFWRGTIHKLKIWNAVMSDEQIAKAME